MYDINKLKHYTYKRYVTGISNIMPCNFCRLPDVNGPRWPGNINDTADKYPEFVVFNSVWTDDDGNEVYAEINIISIETYNLL